MADAVDGFGARRGRSRISRHANGAGMYRLLTAAAFVKNNMPAGTTFTDPVISDGDASDVAAFINSQPRPEKADLGRDFPDRLRKARRGSSTSTALRADRQR